MLLPVLFAFVVVAFTQTPPKLSDSFTATVFAEFHTRGHRFHFEGEWYEDAANKKQRFEGMHGGVERGDLFRLWNSTSGGDEWFYRASDKKCDFRGFVDKFYGIWDFLAQAKHVGPCGDHHNQGTRWQFSNQDVSIDGCISTDGKTPFFHDVRLHSEDRGFFVMFQKWNGVAPAPTVFALPATCKKQ